MKIAMLGNLGGDYWVLGSLRHQMGICMLQTKIRNNLIGLRLGDGKPLAFHRDTLEIAELSEDSWQALHRFDDSVNPALDELLSWSQVTEESLPKPASNKTKINTLTLNMTQICNLACTYCAAGGDGTYGDPVRKIAIDKTLPQLDFFLNKLTAGDSFSITFLGGEPLLYPEGISLVSSFLTEKATEKNISLNLRIVTNGTLLNEANVSLLAQFKMNVVVSLDGPPEINDQIRKSKSPIHSTASIVKNLSQLFEVKNQLGSISITAVFGKYNLEVLKSYQYLSEFPVDSISLNFDHSEHDLDTSAKFLEQMHLVAEAAWCKGEEKELRRIDFFNKIFQVLDEKIKITNYCGAGKDFLMVDAKNSLYTCPWQVGKPQEMVGHGETLFVDRLISYQEDLVTKNNCHTCWAKYLCGGGCMYTHQSATGSKNQKDPVFCDRQRGLSLLALYYYGKSLMN